MFWSFSNGFDKMFVIMILVLSLGWFLGRYIFKWFLMLLCCVFFFVVCSVCGLILMLMMCLVFNFNVVSVNILEL